MNRPCTDPEKGLLYSLGGAMLLSTNFVTAKYGLKGFNPETFSFVWTTAAAMYSFLIAISGKSSRNQIFPRKKMKEMLALGIITGIGMIMTWSGLASLDPVFSSFLWRFLPVLTILAGILFLKERLTNKELIAMLIMLSGSLVGVVGRWEIVGTGVVLTLLAGCAATAQLLIAKTQIEKIHPSVLVAYRVGIGAAITGVWVFSTGKADFSVDSSYWYVTLLGAFLGPCASFHLIFRSYQYWSLSQSSILLTMQPLLVLPLAYLFLGSFPTPKELLGGTVILSGALCLSYFQLGKKKE